MSKSKEEKLRDVRWAFRQQKLIVSSSKHGGPRKLQITRACALLELEAHLDGRGSDGNYNMGWTVLRELQADYKERKLASRDAEEDHAARAEA